MPREFSRSERVGVQLQRELAELIRAEVHDPRVGNVTVCDVAVSRDLAYARIYVLAFGGDREAGEDAVEALNHAAGFLRHQLSRRMRLRSVPELRFFYDETLETGARINALIEGSIPGPKGSDT